MPASTYTAIIRWRGPDPSLELETRHPGFGSPEEAALYANGIPPGAPSLLHLASDGTAILVLNDETEIPCPPDRLTVWSFPANSVGTDDVTVVYDEDFEPCPQGELEIRYSAHGDYTQAQYGVLDPYEAPLDVRVDWDSSNRLRVTVIDNPPPVPQPAQVGSFGILPDA